MTTSTQSQPAPGGPATRSAVPAAHAVELSKVYGEGETRVVALDRVTVEFRKAQFTAIMGPSGSGKSTLMHCMAGLDSVSSGRAMIGETEITGLREKWLTR
uniref:ATP-binding cassette domain-containing protein n=1 Tax=Streptomyces xiaopingdaonensis TaxID=1565415 RepID=UPI000360F6D2